MDADLANDQEVIEELQSLTLYARRLEWDLAKLRDVVKGDDRKVSSSRTDPNHWRGERP